MQSAAIANNNMQINVNNNIAELPVTTQLYLRRWVILSIFCLITLLSSFNWIQYVIIQDVVIIFYNQSLPTLQADKFDAVNWLSMIYMLAYIPLVFPSMYLLNRKGLKISVLIGALLNFIGSVIKCCSVRGDLFSVAMTGQIFCAIAQSFILGIPARLSALWFGVNEVSLATSVIYVNIFFSYKSNFLNIIPSLLTSNVRSFKTHVRCKVILVSMKYSK